MPEKSIIIIGAGIAGLAAGCYARMNGYRVKIFEMHDLPGGLCTAWERRGYVFDGCIHYLFGSGEGQPFHEMWMELGAAQNRPMIHHDEYQRITDGKDTLTVHADPELLQRHMLDLSPDDASLIRSFCDGIRQFTRFDMSAMYRKPRAIMRLLDYRDLGVAMMPYLGAVMKWATLSAGGFAKRFKNPFLRKAVPQIFSWDEAPVMMGMSLLAYMHTRNAGFPAGGSLEFARAIEKRFIDLGGEIFYKSQVEKILVVNDRAVGVRLYNDEVHHADYVISACDGRATIFDMLGGAYADRRIRRMYDGHMPTHSMMQISLGVKRDLSVEPHWVTHLLGEPVLVAGEPRHEIGVKHYCFDKSLAPAGKSVIEVIVRSDYSYWQRIYGRRLYDTEQTQVSGIIVDHLEHWYPGIKKDIEFVDEATPLSYERYTGNWLGSTCGWLMTKETMPMLIKGVPKTLPRLGNFFMAGQWVEPGGSLPLAAASGKSAVQLICHQDGKRFVVSAG
ncbi:MAG: NAD(P)/FAD-dependent oxidoreductase [Chloroflexi bacterium]|nr:NAD(P)/FAD-dependent oxidoreductase [Chloroflexota bacterium]